MTHELSVTATHKPVDVIALIPVRKRGLCQGKSDPGIVGPAFSRALQ